MRIIKSNLSIDDKRNLERIKQDIAVANDTIDVLLDFAAETTMELCMMELGLEDGYDNL